MRFLSRVIWRDRVQRLYIYEMKIIGKIEKEDVIDIICDICGRSTKTELADYEYAELSARWGYLSRNSVIHCVPLG